MLSHRNGGHSGLQAYLSAEQAAVLQAKADAGEVGTIWEGVEWAKKSKGLLTPTGACAGCLPARLGLELTRYGGQW